MANETPVPAQLKESAKAPDPPKIRAITFAPSTNIVGVVYDEANEALDIQFKNGTYRYADVPSNVADGFTNAPSAGRYFIEFVRDLYEFERIA